MTERLFEYTKTRVKPGVYLQISDDLKTLYRFHKYDEDGSLSVLQEDNTTRNIKGTFWAVSKLVDADPMLIRRDADSHITGVTRAVAYEGMELEDLDPDGDLWTDWYELADLFPTLQAAMTWVVENRES